MTIDIISYTEEQYAVLPEAHILEIQNAQLKKNRLIRKLEEDKQTAKERLIENGTFLSGLWEQRCAQLEEVCAQEVEAIREALLFYLRYTGQANNNAGNNTLPEGDFYKLDYSLSVEERFYVVKEYSESKYATALDRYNVFKEDQIAKSYLGEVYKPLHDYFYTAMREETI